MNKNKQESSVLQAQNLTLEMIAIGQPLVHVLEKIIYIIEEFIPNAYCSILIFNEDEHSLEDCIAPSLAGEYINAINGIKIGPNVGSCGTAAFRKETVIVEDIENDPLWKEYRSLALTFGLRACWSKPILSSNEEVVGTFALYYKEPKGPNLNEQELFESFAHLAALALERWKTEQVLQQNEANFNLIADNVTDFVGIVDKNGAFEYTSPSYEKFLGYSSHDLMSKVWIDYVHPNDRCSAEDAIKKMLQTIEKQRIFFRFKHKQGHWIPLEGEATPIIESYGNVNRYIYISRDVTEKMKTEEKVKETNRFLHTLIQSAPVAIVAFDRYQKVTLWNPAAERIFNWDKSEVLGQSYPLLNDKTSKHQHDWLKNVVKEGRVFVDKEEKRQKKDGTIIDVSVSTAPLYNSKGKIDGAIGILQDISNQKKAEQRIYHLAFYDMITDLPNHVYQEHITEILESAEQKKRSLALLYIDVNRFKYINDTLGYDYGNDLLKLIANRLKTHHNSVYHISGDEFVILLNDTNQKRVAYIAEHLFEVFEEPFRLGHHQVNINMSIGISLYPDLGKTDESLMKKANIAVPKSKKNQTSHYQFYTMEMSHKINKQMELEQNLHTALEKEEFIVYFQPQVDIKTGELIGSEALVRWNRGDLGIVSPADFIPIAEETGLIIPIDQWVLREACKQQKQWLSEGYPLKTVSVNLSVQQFYQGNLVSKVTQILRETELDPHYLILEITESIVMEKTDVATRKLKQLKDMGIKIALDDFGTGYSSLNYLKNLPIDIVKIDRSFIQDMDSDPKAKEILSTIILLTKQLGLTVLAEGIETEKHLRFLEEHQCFEGQGFLFSPPVPSRELQHMLERKIDSNSFHYF